MELSFAYARIIALDLGKFKTVACDFDVAARGHAFDTVATSPQGLGNWLAAATKPALLGSGRRRKCPLERTGKGRRRRPRGQPPGVRPEVKNLPVDSTNDACGVSKITPDPRWDS